MLRRAVVVALLALPFWILTGGSALADTVVLKNGRRIEGRLVQENEKEVTIETHGGVLMRFERKVVASVEQEAKSAGPVKQAVPEDLGVPDGASDDEVERLRVLVPQPRDTARRYVEAKKEKEDAEKAGSKDVAYLSDRAKEFGKQLDSLKAARETIDRSAADRLTKAQRLARAEADQLRADTDKLKAALDATGLADRAQKLRARAPENPREPRHDPLLGEALYAMEAAGDADEKLARDAKSAESKVAGFLRAGEHFAWCMENDPKSAERLMKRVVSVLSEGHRAAGFETQAVERALENLQAYGACAQLVDERLGERRWGPELAENEVGQYRIELKDRVAYGNEPPGSKEAKTARERRDRTENRTKKDDKGQTLTILVKITRWYELVWDPKKKRWARESGVTELESKKLVPLLGEAQEKADALARARKELDAATRAALEKREALKAIRRKAEQADATDDALDKAAKEAAEQAKLVLATQDGVAQAQAALGVKQRELVDLEKEIERARKGE